ncbi:MAG: pseudouridine-5'-phosphate glycosidase [Candidatus Dormibacteria bacterium]
MKKNGFALDQRRDLAPVDRSTTSHPLAPYLRVDPEVVAALCDGTPVVALESALITHGFDHPENVAVARSTQATIRAAGAVPAIIAIHQGQVRVGLTDSELEHLASDPEVLRASRPTLAYALNRDGWASTTVSATLIACAAAGIRVFATGGIGGMHRSSHPQSVNEPASLDVSSDLDELAHSQVAVVCAGPKSILAVAATIEALETRGVPVVTIGGTQVPGYWSEQSDVVSPISVASVADAARIANLHLSLDLGGLLICTPIPAASAIPRDELERNISTAIADAESAGVHGPAVTPWVLTHIAERTSGRTLTATIALVTNSAQVAAELAARLRG